jgi:DNA modification methylase
MKISLIKPYEKNAKKHPAKQVKQVAASIKEFGFNQPIVVDKKNVIIVGHGRYEAAKLLELKDVPVVVVDLTEAQAKAYRLADNKLNESDWDMELVVDELKTLSMEMLDLTGFDRDLVLDGDEADDIVPAIPKVARSKRGDIYELGKHRVMCGDSVNVKDVEKLMREQKSDMVFTDPPWNVAIGEDSNPRHRQREGLINDNLGKDFGAFLDGLSKNILDFNKGDVYCVMGCEEWPNIHRALTEVGLHWSSTIVWAKDIFVLGRSKYHRQYEPIWYGWKGKSKSTYRGDRKQSDLWQCKRPKRSDEHPTMKPVELVEKALVNSSRADDIVLDLFLGGGSTLIACEKSERICYGMEIDPKYADVIVQRYVDFTGKTKVVKNGKIEVWQPSAKEKSSTAQ